MSITAAPVVMMWYHAVPPWLRTYLVGVLVVDPQCRQVLALCGGAVWRGDCASYVVLRHLPSPRRARPPSCRPAPQVVLAGSCWL